MGKPTTSLNDKYLLNTPQQILLAGRQALVRLPLVQRELDRRRGLNTAGFISGYRGSPLGGYDTELWKAQDFLSAANVHFLPGLNEDLAATAIMGTQQLAFTGASKVDGVFGIWYGKGPGVDRSGDAFKHANMQGTEQHGGILLAFGDDHGGKSSTIAHQSDLAIAANDIPVLYPANVAEVLTLGLAGLALSRYSGLLVGLKLVNEIAEATQVVATNGDAYEFTVPPTVGERVNVHARKEFLVGVEQDIRVVRHKLPRAHEFAHANRLDRITFGVDQPRLLVLTAGKTYADVMWALKLLEIDSSATQALALAVYKLAMIFPVEPQGLRAASYRASEVLVIEEKRSQIERQAAVILFNSGRTIRMFGKEDPHGRPFIPADVQLDPLSVALKIADWIADASPEFGLSPRFAAVVARLRRRAAGATSVSAPALRRRPEFCAGCPHNGSTVVPEGSLAMTGTGCHTMAVFHPDRNPLPLPQMGAEGASWIGLSRFTKVPHVFQNMGDGTYNHSGLLAIRAAVQCQVNITYKILFNSAVAMTGGQPVEGGITVSSVARQLLAEGVAEPVIVAENPRDLRRREKLPAGVKVHGRDALGAVQRRLRAQKGVTAIIYDQTCAVEKRRRRKRGSLPDPPRRILINPWVCEGCGDCSVQSNCVAIQPLETDLGRKRQIDQSACNKDFSCTRGFCPSFVSVIGAPRRAGILRGLPSQLPELPHVPSRALTSDFNILVAGVGGTGVVTISAIVAMAAKVDGKGACVYDMTGLSQKGGAVFSHVRLLAAADAVVPARIGAEEADLLLACDLIAATQGEALQAVGAQRTEIVANSDVTATADFASNPDLDLGADQFIALLVERSGRDLTTVAATKLALSAFGDSIGGNMLLLGLAWQKAQVPLSLGSIEEAIRLNGASIDTNLLAFKVGRWAAVNPKEVIRLLLPEKSPRSARAEDSLDSFIEQRASDLSAYWSEQYSRRYLNIVRDARNADNRLSGGAGRFSWAVARVAYKLMAYKDEYEVGRLFSDGRFRQELEAQFEGARKLRFHLAPPSFWWLPKRNGRPEKITLGTWALWLFKGLALLKGVRETPFDIFRYTAERRLERDLRDTYLAFVERSVACIDAARYERLATLAESPLSVRGFGAVKEARARDVLRSLSSP